MQQPYILEVNNLNVTFGNEDIIKDLSFKVEPGELLTIMGPNGAGKSVLVRTLLGLLPHEGEIIWHKKSKIGYLPQGLTQVMMKGMPLTVNDFFALKGGDFTHEKTVEFLQKVGLQQSIMPKMVGDLSGGEFQRMLIAWVLISEPATIFLDEPTTGVDIGGGETIYSLLHRIQKEKSLTIFLATHDMNVVFKHSTNVLCLSKKAHSCFGVPKEILTTDMLEDIFGMEIKVYEHN